MGIPPTMAVQLLPPTLDRDWCLEITIWSCSNTTPNVQL